MPVSYDDDGPTDSFRLAACQTEIFPSIGRVKASRKQLRGLYHQPADGATHRSILSTIMQLEYASHASLSTSSNRLRRELFAATPD